MDKSLRQDIAIQKVVDNNWNGILDLCIRFGKTRIGLKLDKLFRLGNRLGTAAILVPSDAIKQGWLKEDVHIKSNPVIITTSQVLSLNTSLYVDLLIVDECHKYTGDVTYSLINGLKIRYKHIVMLTGSMPTKEKSNMLLKVCPIIDEITEQEALSNNWISNYVEFNIPIQLTEEEELRYLGYSNIISNTLDKYRNLYRSITYNDLPVFSDDLDLLFSLVINKQLNKFVTLDKESIAKAIIAKMNNPEYWTIDIITKEASDFRKAINNRNLMLTSSEGKLDAVLELYSKLQLPTICFNEFIPFTDKVAHIINSNFGDIAISYHSKVESKPLINPDTKDYYRYVSGERKGEPKLFSKSKQLEYTIELFRHGLVKVLSCVKSLNEGITIPEIECIITTSGSMNPIQYKQRTGRGKTLFRDDKVTRIYNIYYDNFIINGKEIVSRDKTKLQLRQQGSANVKEIFLADV